MAETENSANNNCLKEEPSYDSPSLMSQGYNLAFLNKLDNNTNRIEENDPQNSLNNEDAENPIPDGRPDMENYEFSKDSFKEKSDYRSLDLSQYLKIRPGKDIDVGSSNTTGCEDNDQVVGPESGHEDDAEDDANELVDLSSESDQGDQGEDSVGGGGDMFVLEHDVSGDDDVSPSNSSFPLPAWKSADIPFDDYIQMLDDVLAEHDGNKNQRSDKDNATYASRMCDRDRITTQYNEKLAQRYQNIQAEADTLYQDDSDVDQMEEVSCTDPAVQYSSSGRDDHDGQHSLNNSWADPCPEQDGRREQDLQSPSKQREKKPENDIGEESNIMMTEEEQNQILLEIRAIKTDIRMLQSELGVQENKQQNILWKLQTYQAAFLDSRREAIVLQEQAIDLNMELASLRSKIGFCDSPPDTQLEIDNDIGDCYSYESSSTSSPSNIQRYFPRFVQNDQTCYYTLVPPLSRSEPCLVKQKFDSDRSLNSLDYTFPAPTPHAIIHYSSDFDSDESPRVVEGFGSNPVIVKNETKNDVSLDSLEFYLPIPSKQMGNPKTPSTKHLEKCNSESCVQACLCRDDIFFTEACAETPILGRYTVTEEPIENENRNTNACVTSDNGNRFRGLLDAENRNTNVCVTTAKGNCFLGLLDDEDDLEHIAMRKYAILTPDAPAANATAPACSTVDREEALQASAHGVDEDGIEMEPVRCPSCGYSCQLPPDRMDSFALDPDELDRQWIALNASPHGSPLVHREELNKKKPYWKLKWILKRLKKKRVPSPF